MPTLINKPTRIEAAGTPPKTILEYVGVINTGNCNVSIAHMKSPCGWVEPGQRPEFEEYTIVLRGELCVNTEDGTTHKVAAGNAIITHAGEWVQYHTPSEEGAEYIAVCLPAFSPDTVHRDE